MEHVSIVVDEEQSGERIDVFLAHFLEGYSRSWIQKLIRSGHILMNDKPVRPNTKCHAGAAISVEIPEPEVPDIQAEAMDLDILYEDNDLIFVNKPKGLVVHPAPGHYTGTLVNGLLAHCGEELSGINGVLRPGIVHRIDMDTTGVLVVCKNDFSHNHVAAQLAEHTINRRYLAIVHGVLKEETGTIDLPIGRSRTNRLKMAVDHTNGKRAVTHYRVLQRFDRFTYIECRLETGRTHQIRVHMAQMHHPLLGDTLYGNLPTHFHLQGQTLHAQLLGLNH
ncbi:MAG: RluA family pseudouridine synthase, partial [Lachnospiraceae bacterium]|nr:RluA family pseudouridine synthase [Lachnospiraceae bacterium]